MAHLHEKHMLEAIHLATKGMDGNHGGPFGAVVARGNEIIGRGYNSVLSQNDPTAHAEIVAIRNAAQKLQNPWLEGCDLYTSCEPCPMCLATALWARIQNVYYAANRHDAAEIGFDDAQFYEELMVQPAMRMLKIEQMGEEYRGLARDVMLRWKTETAGRHY
ncbi:MAG: nucleoside deaminase [Candidatus Peribacteraceae bacterium]